MSAGALDPVDAQLLARFQRQGFSREEWTHPMHVRLGWIHLRRWSFGDAMDRMRAGIRALNESNGVVNDDDGGYHETITRAWLLLIAKAGDAETSEEFLRRNAGLLRKDALLGYYSRGALMNVQARRGWVQGDLQSL